MFYIWIALQVENVAQCDECFKNCAFRFFPSVCSTFNGCDMWTKRHKLLLLKDCANRSSTQCAYGSTQNTKFLLLLVKSLREKKLPKAVWSTAPSKRKFTQVTAQSLPYTESLHFGFSNYNFTILQCYSRFHFPAKFPHPNNLNIF